VDFFSFFYLRIEELDFAIEVLFFHFEIAELAVLITLFGLKLLELFLDKLQLFTLVTLLQLTF
jgi:hypothetical protein